MALWYRTVDFQLYRPILVPPAPTIQLDPAALSWRNGLLVRATNWLGDALMTLPAVYRLSQRVPDPCGVFVMCPAGLAPLWAAVPWVSQVIPMAGSRCGAAERRVLRRLRPGVAVVLPNSFGSAWDVWRSGAPTRLGRAGRGRGWLLTHRLPEWPRRREAAGCHQLSHYLDLAAVLGPVEASAAAPPLRVADAAAVARAQGVDDAAGPWLAVAPGAAYGPAKQWPVERFTAVARWWQSRGGRVVVVGAAKERAAGAAIAAALPEVLDLTGRTDLRQLMAVLAVSGLVVANDSGAMHLGAALGCRGVAIFGSTDPVATGPIGGQWVVLADQPADCAPCLQRTCPRANDPYACLRSVQPEDVCQALVYLAALPDLAEVR
ncbi:MAG: lipopolysaccharide heptosyltransferase II [Lentisphaerae bacterium]|nr:lipopolysaccharide heptosyltransferase II [Lentisphaerota bacterium]